MYIFFQTNLKKSKSSFFTTNDVKNIFISINTYNHTQNIDYS